MLLRSVVCYLFCKLVDSSRPDWRDRSSRAFLFFLVSVLSPRPAGPKKKINVGASVLIGVRVARHEVDEEGLQPVLRRRLLVLE